MIDDRGMVVSERERERERERDRERSLSSLLIEFRLPDNFASPILKFSAKFEVLKCFVTKMNSDHTLRIWTIASLLSSLGCYTKSTTIKR